MTTSVNCVSDINSHNTSVSTCAIVVGGGERGVCIVHHFSSCNCYIIATRVLKKKVKGSR